MNASIRRFLNEEDGVTALEYGLLAAVIAGILVVVGKEQITSFFTSLFTALTKTAENATTAAE
ncbi:MULTISPECIES: Flp family type IVb pilin [unclassified Stenotrophomonas]|uniref:Flp family type IVb pilin n=1 Tax=unclassified Stenotrophomonas TaxID=196198 RepID=UPI00190DD9CB|nr:MULTISPECIES: Flp family type IVb pilin [unclassified Stenotrophomonas]MBK0055536.1 Flp family type IVb pilin [Stenotrophomonas sp. S39]MDI9273511.1 Flp family type IVb pilin [Stenotrophomonas sp. PFBMAA-4]